MISPQQFFSDPNSISPAYLNNSTDSNGEVATAFSAAIFATDANWGEGDFSFKFRTDIEFPYHEIDIFYTEDGNITDLTYDTELTSTVNVTDTNQWDEHVVFNVPAGRQYIFISYVFNPGANTTLVVPDDYKGNLYIDDVDYTVPTPAPGGQRMMRTRRSNTQ